MHWSARVSHRVERGTGLTIGDVDVGKGKGLAVLECAVLSNIEAVAGNLLVCAWKLEELMATYMVEGLPSSRPFLQMPVSVT